jgi:FkbM family methyltransferase
LNLDRIRRRLAPYRAYFGLYFVAVRAIRRLDLEINRNRVKTVPYLGHQFAYPADSTIGRHLAKHREWDAILARIVASAFVRNDVFVCEVGSNIGASLLQILRGKPGASVLALEPSDRFRPFLIRNLEAAGVEDRVRVLASFVGESAGSVTLYNNETTASAARPIYSDHNPRGEQEVAVTTLDVLLATEPRLDFLKVDTDGFDFKVLRGAAGVLADQKPLLFFELVPSLMPTALADLAWLGSLGYGRLICLSPGQEAEVMGTTREPSEAIHWAARFGYCDVLCWHDASPKGRFEALELELLGG